MDYKTTQKRYEEEKNSYGHEDKQNGFMENRTKVQKMW